MQQHTDLQECCSSSMPLLLLLPLLTTADVAEAPAMRDSASP